MHLSDRVPRLSRFAQVESCEPAVHNMEELVTQLNTSNDFAAFVRAMRKRFKALC